MLKKFLAIIAAGVMLPVFSAGADFPKVISESNIKKSDISVSIINLETGKEVYQLHSKRKFYPGSVQKLITYKVAENTLGLDYRFKTSLYKNANNEYLIKLGADPLLTGDNLKTLVTKIQPNAKAIYIDDSIIDSEDWGAGWDEEDNLNPELARFSAYNLDGNVVKVSFVPTTEGAPVTIAQEKFYPLSFINEIVTGDKNEILLTRKDYIAPDMIIASGVVDTLMSRNIPVTNTKRYFKLSLERILNEEKIDYSGVYRFKKLSPEFKEIAIISHGMEDIQKAVLKDSNNIAAESLFKVAASKAAKDGVGTFYAGLALLHDYCAALKLKMDDIKIADASGVSEDNLLTAEFVAEFLANPANTSLKLLLPTPGEGTLVNRMNYMTGKLFAKTGLVKTNSIAGYVDALSGETYAFCILINDKDAKNSDKKMLEEYLIREIYTKL